MEKPTAANVEGYRTWRAGLEAFAARWRSDPGARARLPELTREFGMALPAGVEARVAEDSDDVTHVVFPPDPNDTLADESLGAVSGGIRVSPAMTDFCFASTARG